MSWRGANGLYIARKLGLLANLIYCLDVGDAASYDGSAQTISDLSGNGHTFNLGATNGVEATDPTFNGVAGRLSKDEYFSLDGGDYLTIASMPAALETFHKDSALLTIAGWWYFVTGVQQTLWSTRATSSSSVGLSLITNTGSDQLRFHAGVSSLNAGMLTPTANAWNFIAVSFDEAAATNNLLNRINGQTLTGSGTYGAPTATDAGAHAIGMNRAASQPMLTGSRIGRPIWTWQRALSHAELAALFDATRGIYGV